MDHGHGDSHGRATRSRAVNTHRRGRRYEELAQDFLRRSGWRVLARNYRHGRNEVDLIVQRRGVVAFVEVKGRRGGGFGHPLEAITRLKRREIARVARAWLREWQGEWQTLRFDAVAVHDGGPGAVRIEHMEDAWRLE